MPDEPISIPRLTEESSPNALNELGEKIFLDRYALKDMTKSSIKVGDTVVVCVDLKSGQREMGRVKSMLNGDVTVQLRDGVILERAKEHVDKPFEFHPEQMMERVARGIARIEGAKSEEWYEKFRWLMEGWKFLPGGRILSAAGSDQQLTYYNCYVVPSPKDSRRGIVDTLSQMMEIMSRGGGVGINVSSLRPKHCYVKGVNGRSSGSVSWGALYSFVTGLIEQGGSRRGALMLILNCWHPDIMEFIQSKREMGKITNANISVGITDDFMDAVKADAEWPLVFPDTNDTDYDALWDGDLAKWKGFGKPVLTHRTVRARDVWNAIIESAWASAEPGVFFEDRYNKQSNSWYFAPIHCTNPCVTGDTILYTDRGLRTARELFEAGDEVGAVLDGRFGYAQTISRASSVFPTGRKTVFRLQTREGYHLRATEDHRIMTPAGWTELCDLRPGDRIHLLNRKGGFGAEGSLELGRTLGWLVGDGTLKKNEAVLSFFGEEKLDLAPLFAGYVNAIVEPLTATVRRYEVSPVQVPSRDEARIGSTRLHAVAREHGLTECKHRVPETVLRGSEEMQRGFLQALFTADGTVQDGGEKGASVRLAASRIELLEGVQRVLLNFGIASRIYRNRREAGSRLLPDSHREPKLYPCKAQHELVISKRNRARFASEIGFLLPSKQEKLDRTIGDGVRGPYSESFTATVESIVEDGVEEVFDLTEPVTHSFVANGIVVHNCGEQGLPGFGVCNLGALNLGKFAVGDRVGACEVDWEALGTSVRYAVRFLDDVIDSTPYFFEENRRQQMSERRVGLGVMGLADLLIRLGIRYGSPECLEFLDRLFGFMARESYLASADIAEEKGAFPKYDADKFLASGFMRGMPEEVRDAIRGKGCRNVTLLTVAPTGTTGTMVGTSTGIEPFFFWSYFRKSRLGMHEENVAVLKEWKEENEGDSPLPDYFTTAMDMTPEEHVRAQAAVQRWVDSSISKTCNVPNSYTVEQTRELYELMYETGCKGGTIYRDGSRDAQVLNLKEEEKEEAPRVEKPIEKVRPRPYKRYGVTVSQASPSGTAHITMNDDADGRPFEVFVDIGKGGSDIKAMAEAMGRLMSLLLRINSPLSPRERISEIIGQIKGIGGARSLGFGKHRVRSLPDAVAMALEEHYGVEGANGSHHDHEPDEAEGEPVGSTDGAGRSPARPNLADLCPECGVASFIRKEGCHTCESCGYSEC